MPAQSLFEDKTWQLSPSAWPLTPAQVTELEQIGTACLEFHAALETLYLRSVAGKNLLRNKPLLAPWVADYLDRGKPADLDPPRARPAESRASFPFVLRPDLLLTDEGFALTELDSVPGGIGLTAFLNNLYGGEADPAILGHGGAMEENFHQSLAALRPAARNPLIAILVSDEAATYRPEMQWLAEQLQRRGRRIFCLRVEDVFPLGGELFFNVEGTPEKIDIIYRFFELFDWANIRIAAQTCLEAWQSGAVSDRAADETFSGGETGAGTFSSPPAAGVLGGDRSAARSLETAAAVDLPQTWVMWIRRRCRRARCSMARGVGGRDAQEATGADFNVARPRRSATSSIKISGFHETAWGCCSVSSWAAIAPAGMAGRAVDQGAGSWRPTNLHVLQEYRKPKPRVSSSLPSGRGRRSAAHSGEVEGRPAATLPLLFRRGRAGPVVGGAGDLLPAGQKDYPRDGRCGLAPV